MRLTRVLWYTCTMLVALGMLVASASTAVPQHGSTPRGGDPVVAALGSLLRH